MSGKSKRQVVAEAQERNHRKKMKRLRKMLPVHITDDEVTVSIMFGENEVESTVATGIFDDWNGGYVGRYIQARANSKCHPNDVNDTRIGVLLATGRAFVKLGQAMIRDAEGLVKHHEDMVIQRAAQAAKPRKDPTDKNAA